MNRLNSEESNEQRVAVLKGIQKTEGRGPEDRRWSGSVPLGRIRQRKHRACLFQRQPLAAAFVSALIIHLNYELPLLLITSTARATSGASTESQNRPSSVWRALGIYSLITRLHAVADIINYR